MTAVVALTVLLIISGGVGLLIYRLRQGRRFRVGLMLISLVLALLFTLGAAILFQSLGGSDSDFTDASYHDSKLEIVFLQGSPAPHMLLTHQTRSQVGQDFQLVVRVDGAPPGQYMFELSGPKSLEPRTIDRCDVGQTPPGGSSYACSRISTGRLEVRWHITPTSPGQFLCTVVLPESLRPATLIGPSWTANVVVDGQQIVFDRDGSRTFDGDRDNPRNPRLRLSQTQPRLHHGSSSGDLARGTLTAQVEIVRSLGVSEHTYTILAIVGTTLAGGLGSGWLVQLIGWVIRRWKLPAPPGGPS